MAANLIDLLPGSPRVLDLALKATLILAAAGAAAMALRRSSAAARHLAWSLGLGGALVLPALSLALPAWSWRVLPTAEPGRPTADAPARRTESASPVPDPLEDLSPDEETLAATTPTGPPSRPTSPAPLAPPSRSWRMPMPAWSWLRMTWLAGCLAVLSGSIAGRIALRRCARQAEPITDDDWTALLDDLSASLGLKGGTRSLCAVPRGVLREHRGEAGAGASVLTEHPANRLPGRRVHPLRRRITLLRGGPAAMPMTWGWLRPAILLPPEADAWDPDRRRAVLLHELAHVKRFDGPTQTMARIACAVYWFHPLAWYAARRMRIERERACDDVVLLAGARPSAYAGHLLEIARDLRSPRAAGLAALAMARPSQLEGRLLAILDPARPRRGPGRGLAMMALLAASLVMVPLAMVRVGAQPAPAPTAGNPPTADPAARMTVTGRVLDPQGRPVPGASVMVLVRSKYSDRPMEIAPFEGMTAREGRCDASGHFRIDLPRTTSARHDELVIAAMAPGFGIGWTEADPDADSPAVDVPLRPEQVIRGRLFDVQGQPARGVTLWVRSVNTIVRGTISPPIVRPDVHDHTWRTWPAWPGPATSDADGRFVLRGLGPDLQCLVHADDPRFALPPTLIQTHPADPRVLGVLLPVIKVEPGPDPKPIAIALQPARTITGRVTYADTGRPAPHARISAGVLRTFEADADGRFRIPARVASRRGDRFSINAYPPDGTPYLMVAKAGEWPRGAVELSVDIALPRGAVVRGKVTEEGTGRPVAGAVVRVTPSRTSDDLRQADGVAAATGPDGTYRITSPPGPGYVVVQGPDDDYVLREFGAEGGSFQARPGRRRSYAHAYRAVDLKSDGPDREVDLTVRRGAAVRVRAVAPDGQTPRDVWVYSRVIIWNQPRGGWKEWSVIYGRGRGHTRDGFVTLHGLEPAVEVPAFFLEPERKLGAVARFTGRSAAGGPATVRLEPCGAARARLVDPDGKPVAAYPAEYLAAMVVTPESPRIGAPKEEPPLLPNQEFVSRLDTVNYGSTFQSDAQGRLTFPALIPGATYRIIDITPANAGDRGTRKEFTVQPGETIDLGDILISRPRRRD